MDTEMTSAKDNTFFLLESSMRKRNLSTFGELLARERKRKEEKIKS
jgi:hypothetical protein